MKIVKTRAFKDRLKGHKDTIISINSPNGPGGGMLLSASKDGQLRAWDLVERQITCKLLLSRWPNETTVYEQGQQEEEVPQQKDDKRKLVKDVLNAATFNEKNVYGGYEDGLVCSWNMKSGELLYNYEGHTAAVTSMHFLNARQLCSSSLDGTIRLWDTSCGVCETIIKFGQQINYMRVTAQLIQVLYSKNTISEVNINTLKLGNCYQFPGHSITTFIIHEDQLVLATVDNVIHVYSVTELVASQQVQEATGDKPIPTPVLKPKLIIEGNQGWALSIEVLEKYIYFGTDERKIRVYNLKTWQLVEEFIGHEDGITQIAFADNMLYSGSYDHSIRSWDLKEMYNRIRERAIMYREDINSKRQEVYLKALPKKKKGKANKKKK